MREVARLPRPDVEIVWVAGVSVVSAKSRTSLRRGGGRSLCGGAELDLHVSYLAGREHLPIVTLKRMLIDEWDYFGV